MEPWLHSVLALFAVLNPVGNLPLFLELTEDLDDKSRRAVFKVAIGTGFLTLLVMTLLGRWVMTTVFQINIMEFKVAGGILLTVLAVKYIAFPQAKKKHDIQASKLESMNLGAVPMAVPLLVGPGSIVTGILILNRSGYAVTIGAIVSVFFLIWFFLLLSPLISRLLGRLGRLVISRILWIFLAAIGAHFLLSGISEYFHLAAG